MEQKYWYEKVNKRKIAGRSTNRDDKLKSTIDRLGKGKEERNIAKCY